MIIRPAVTDTAGPTATGKTGMIVEQIRKKTTIGISFRDAHRQSVGVPGEIAGPVRNGDGRFRTVFGTAKSPSSRKG